MRRGVTSNVALPPMVERANRTVFTVRTSSAFRSTRPLIETLPPTNSARQLMIYGKRNLTYTIQYCTNLLPGTVWTTRGTVQMKTNLALPLPVGNTPAPPVFYRAATQ